MWVRAKIKAQGFWKILIGVHSITSILKEPCNLINIKVINHFGFGWNTAAVLPDKYCVENNDSSTETLPWDADLLTLLGTWLEGNKSQKMYGKEYLQL